MLSKEEFSALCRDFTRSQEFVQLAHDWEKGPEFVCHHNSYLVTKFLRQLEHDCVWVSGYYRTALPAPPIRHSWVEVRQDGKHAAILEFDPRQLFKGGGYANDLMPSGEIPEWGITISPIAVIFDPDLVDFPEGHDLMYIVRSKEVLERYVQDWSLLPDGINVAELDALAAKIKPYYDAQEKDDTDDDDES